METNGTEVEAGQEYTLAVTLARLNRVSSVMPSHPNTHTHTHTLPMPRFESWAQQGK